MVKHVFIVVPNGCKDIATAQSMSHPVWASTQTGTPNLEEYYASGEEVYLYFTMYRVRKFFGLARMSSPMNGPKSACWDEWHKFGKTCTVEWLVKGASMAIPPKVYKIGDHYLNDTELMVEEHVLPIKEAMLGDVCIVQQQQQQQRKRTVSSRQTGIKHFFKRSVRPRTEMLHPEDEKGEEEDSVSSDVGSLAHTHTVTP